MSRYVLVPDNPNSGNINIKIPSGLMDHHQMKKIDKKKIDKKKIDKKIKKIIHRLKKRGVSRNSAGQAVHNGHVLKDIKYDKAVYYAALGNKKRKYVEINDLL